MPNFRGGIPLGVARGDVRALPSVVPATGVWICHRLGAGDKGTCGDCGSHVSSSLGGFTTAPTACRVLFSALLLSANGGDVRHIGEAVGRRAAAFPDLNSAVSKVLNFLLIPVVMPRGSSCDLRFSTNGVCGAMGNGRDDTGFVMIGVDIELWEVDDITEGIAEVLGLKIANGICRVDGVGLWRTMLSCSIFASCDLQNKEWGKFSLI